LPTFKSDFFFPDAQDPKLNKLVQETLAGFKVISQAEKVLLVDDSEWRAWANAILGDLQDKVYPDSLAGFRAKQIQQSLKLAIDYSAGRLCYHSSEKAIVVMKEELHRAIVDCEDLFAQFKQLRREWSTKSSIPLQQQTAIKSSKLDFVVVLNFGQTAGRFTKADLKMALETTNTSGLKDLVNTLVEDGRIRMVTELVPDGTMGKGGLNNEEYSQFKQKNILPAVYEVTHKGKKWLEQNV
jgi:hypothetical protein